MSKNPGIADISTYAPETFMTAAEIGSASGIPEDVVRDKFGLAGKHISRADEHVSDMCVAAARPIIDRNDPADIDGVVYIGSHWKDYLVWQAAPRVQHQLGLEGFAMEAVNVSAGAPVGMKVVADILRADDSIRQILVVGASKESHLIDYSDSGSRFMFSFGDGAVAVLMQSDLGRNEVLGSHIVTDGSFSEHVRMPAGGSRLPASPETVAAGKHRLELADGEEMKRRLDPITLKNFIQVTRGALERSGLDEGDIDLLLPIHVKRSLHDSILKELGLEEDQSWYLDHYGHMSAIDPLFSLSQCAENGKLKDGDIVVLLAAGTGYTWAATVLKWGPA